MAYDESSVDILKLFNSPQLVFEFQLKSWSSATVKKNLQIINFTTDFPLVLLLVVSISVWPMKNNIKNALISYFNFFWNLRLIVQFKVKFCWKYIFIAFLSIRWYFFLKNLLISITILSKLEKLVRWILWRIVLRSRCL